MKKTIVQTLCLGVISLGLAIPAFAADEGKKVTISGEGKCAKCAMKEGEKCQNVIQTKEDGKTVTYYLAKNTVSDDFHGNICKETKKVTATGTVKDAAGKKELTASKIELAKE
jgi:hypothetical protein